ncbi:MAG: histidine kinase [Chitinophagales bacterium]
MLLLFIIIVSFIYYISKSKQLKSNLKKIELEQSLFRSQMNPHFIFNTIAGIRGNILNNENDKAVKYLTQFSKLTRAILEQSIEKTITLQEELELLKNYISLQQMRLNNSFNFTINIDDDIFTEAVNIPPMLLQPFIENAIEHGLKGLPYQGLLQIDITNFKENILFISIIDNGKGLLNSENSNIGSLKKYSLSTSISKKRLLNWSKQFKNQSKIEIIDNSKENKEGVTIKIYLEY